MSSGDAMRSTVAPGNIPYEKDPLGRGVELPYVQPVMTSATKWSNKPSFGLSLSVSYQQYWYSKPWMALACDDEKLWQSKGGIGNQEFVMNFDHPVLVSAVTLHRYSWVAPTNHVFFYLDRGGEWEQVGEWTWVKGVDPDVGDFTCAFTRTFWSSRLMLSMPYAEHGYPTLCNVRV